MPFIVPSSTQRIPDGYVEPWNDIGPFAVNTGDRLDLHIDSVTRDAGVTRTDYDMAVIDTPAITVLAGVGPTWTETNVNLAWTADRPRTVLLRLGGGGLHTNLFHGTAFGFSAFQTPVPATFCAYGTEIQPTAAFVYYLTPGLIDVWLAEVGMPWLAPIFTSFWFTTLNVQDLCGSGPPPFPTINLDTLEASAETIFLILRCIAWPNVCRCAAGSPSPTPYPPPGAGQPAGWPVYPTFPCDPAALCASITLIQQQLQALQTTVGGIAALQTLTQRYGLPFAYIPGRRFAGLTGTGTHEIARSVGVLIEVITLPSDLRTKLGVPDYIYDLGWVSVLGPDGMIDEIRLTRTATTWMSKLIPTSTLVGYALRDGVVVDITELLAEP